MNAGPSRPRGGIYALDDAIAVAYQSGRLTISAELQRKIDAWEQRKAAAAAPIKANELKEIAI